MPTINQLSKFMMSGSAAATSSSTTSAKSGNQSVTSTAFSAAMPMIAAVCATSPHCLEKAVCPITISGSGAQALVDTGSSDSFVSNELVQKHKGHSHTTAQSQIHLPPPMMRYSSQWPRPNPISWLP